MRVRARARVRVKVSVKLEGEGEIEGATCGEQVERREERRVYNSE